MDMATVSFGLDAKTEKPDTFGRQQTVVRDSCGRVVGTAGTGKPDYFGRSKTVYRDAGCVPVCRGRAKAGQHGAPQRRAGPGHALQSA